MVSVNHDSDGDALSPLIGIVNIDDTVVRHIRRTTLLSVVPRVQSHVFRIPGFCRLLSSSRAVSAISLGYEGRSCLELARMPCKFHHLPIVDHWHETICSVSRVSLAALNERTRSPSWTVPLSVYIGVRFEYWRLR